MEVSDSATILLYISIGLLSARIFGEIFERLKLSSILGELSAGIIIGGPLLQLFGVDTSKFMDVNSLQQLAQIGILILLFLVGLEINLGEMRRIGKVTTIISVVKIAIILISGTLAGKFLLEGFSINEAIFFALIFTATSIGITVRVLNDMGKMNTLVGRLLLSIAVLDDFIAILLVLIASEILFVSDGTNWLRSIGSHVLYIAIFVLIVIFVIPFILRFLEQRWRIFSKSRTNYFSISIIFGLLTLIAYLSSLRELSGAIMAFIFGLSLQRTPLLLRDVEDIFKKMGESIFIPLFFFVVGAQFVFDVGVFSWIYLVLIAIGILSKALGAFGGSKIVGLDNKISLQIAIGMTPRAEIALIIAEIGLDKGIFSQEIFSMAIMLVFISIIITPILLKWSFKEPKTKEIENETQKT